MDAHQSDDTGSDAELLDNWDVVDTDEADDASLYFNQTDHKMSEEQVEEAPELEDFVPQVDTPDEDFLNESLHLDKAGSESDDGVSVISDDCPEEEEMQEPIESACEEQELLQLGEKGESQYKHRPNPELNLLLNAILVVVVASVSGLAIGHFLGVQEECYAPPLVPAETWNEFNSLNLENDMLKMQLKQLQDSLVEKQSPWNDVVEVPGNIYEEQMNPLEKWSTGVEAAPMKLSEAATAALIDAIVPPLAASPPPPEAAKAPPKRPDSFFGRVEAELEAVMRRVGGHGALQKTAGSVRRWAQQVRAKTATGSTYALEQLKKGVSRAVHGLKKAAAHLNTRRNDTRPKQGGHKRPEWKHADKWRKQQQWRGDDDRWRLKRQQFQQQHKNFKPQNNKWRR